MARTRMAKRPRSALGIGGSRRPRDFGAVRRRGARSRNWRVRRPPLIQEWHDLIRAGEPEVRLCQATY
eukprot:8363075-Alexandrium_andersonii.AAC.1